MKNATKLEEIPVKLLTVGRTVRANDGAFYPVVFVDPVLDPRGNVYETETNQAIVRLDMKSHVSTVLMSGSVTVEAA
jgi:hypothetical protein